MRKWFFLLLCVVCFIPVAASAHSGRTDGSGGHWNRSTGEYHYHHGYSAHDHYDMDGDGIADCPYDFKDNAKVYNNEIDPKSNGRFSMGWTQFVIIIETLIIVWLSVACIDKKRYISKLRDMYFYEVEEIKNDYEKRSKASQCTKEEIICLENKLKNYTEDYNHLKEDANTARTELLYAKRQTEIERFNLQSIQREKESVLLDLYRIRNAPLDISFAEDGYPIYWETQSDKPYGDFTVYDNEKANVFHVDRFCAPYYAHQNHLFNVLPNSRPCRKCARRYEKFKIPEWYTKPQK